MSNHESNGVHANGTPVGQLEESFETRKRLAFNAGGDARLDADPRGTCPHAYGSQEFTYWVRGWDDVDKFWGVNAKWPVRELPAVSEAA